MRKNPILLLGLFDTAIMTSRCFYSTGINIFGMDYNEKNLGFQSKLIKSVKIPDPGHSESDWLQFVLDWLSKKGEIFVVIPTSDEFVILYSKYSKYFSKYCLSIIPGIDVLNTFIERDKQYNAAISCGIKVPFFSTNQASLDNISNENFSFPFAVKPVNAIIWKRIFDHKGFVINKREDFLKAELEISQKSQLRFLVQTIIDGDNSFNYEVNTLYFPDGNLLAHTIRKIRQYPDRFGTATCIEAISNPQVEKLATEFVKKMNLYGFTNMEFKYNKVDGEYYYIETNTRVWLQVNFSMKLGMNFPLLYYKFLTTCNSVEMPKLKNKGKWVDFLPDLLFFKKYRKQYSLSFVGFVKSWFPLISTCLPSLNDPRPFLKDLKLIIRTKAVLK
jgi:predicted ATP-grasp superfamily ATP-dependent carboligase